MLAAWRAPSGSLFRVRCAEALPNMSRYLVTRFITLGLLGAVHLHGAAPRHVLFTWQGDTSTRLTVNYQTFGDRMPQAQVFYDSESRGGAVEIYRHRAGGHVLSYSGR